MKKSSFANYFFTTLITILLFWGGLALTAGLTSCENFLNSADIRQEIEEAIAYNNALSSNLIFRAANGSGDFLTGSEKACKKDYTIDIQFQANLADYVYLGMEAVSSSDASESRSDYVEFKDIGTEVERNNGLYKVRIKLLKQADDILIRPKCLLIPRVKEITPASITNNPAGFDQDTSIRITFNKALDAASFYDFSCLYIFSDEGNLKDYFNLPFFSEDNTVLNIIPKQDMHILKPDSNKKLDLTVSIDFTGIKDKDDLKFVQGLSHKYRINDTFGNQEKSRILVKNDDNSETGAFLLTGESQCTVGYSIDLQFTLNSNNYVYCGLEAVSSQDQNQSRADYVKFTDISTEAEKTSGIHKTQVLVLKKAEDILIRPKCLLIPRIKEITPAAIATNPGGFDQDTIIKIIFNKPVKPESFGDFSCLSIYSNEGDLKNYFNAPQFAEENTQLIISPKQGTLILNPDSNKKLDVTVNIDFKDIRDSDGLSFVQKEPHVYRINDSFGNQKKSRILVRDDDNSITGNFLVTGELQCTVGYSFELQFTLAKSKYAFNSLKAVNRNNSNVSLSDTVEFSVLSHDAENGIYKIQVLVKKESQDILIKPDCRLLPQIESISPENIQAGCDQDSNIVIKFNKSMNPATFAGFNCLSIKNSDGELFSTNPAISYFELPYFSSDNKILTIPTIKGKYIMPSSPAGQRPMEITVKLNAAGIKDAEGYSLQTSEPYSYKINQSKDSVIPEIKSISVSNETDESLWYYRRLTGKSITEWSSETEYEADGTSPSFLNGDYSRNHIQDKVHIVLSGSDNFSGIKCVRIKEVYEKSEGGIDTSKPEYDTEYGEGLFVQDANTAGLYTYSFDYKFRRNASDGLYKLNISVVDKAGNVSEPVTYYVIKDSDLKRKLKWLGYLDVPYSFKGRYNEIITDNCFPQYNENSEKYESKFIFLYFNFNEESFYSSYKTLCKKLLIQQCNSNNEYETIFEEKNLSNKDESTVSNNEVTSQNVITHKINEVLENLVIDPDITTKFRVMLYEENGTINEYPFAIAKRPRICDHRQDGANSFKFIEEEMDYTISADISVNLASENGIVGKKKSGESEISSYKRLSKIYDNCCDEDKCTYYISYARVAMNDSGRIYSAYGKPYVLYRKQGTNMNNFMTYIYSPYQIAGFDFPEIHLPALSEVDFPANTGKARFTVDVEYPEDEYEYQIQLKWNGYIKGFFKSKNIEIDNGLPYKLSLVARNSDGTIVAESEEIDCCYRGPDNYPPSSIEQGWINFSRDKMTLRASYIKDKDGERTVTSEGELWHTLKDKINRVRKIDFFFSPTDLGSNVTLEELKNGDYPMYSLNIPEHTYDDAPVLTIPLYFLEQGKYNVYYYMKDIAGNSALYAVNSNPGCYTLPVLPEYNEKKSVTTYEYSEWYGSSEGEVRKDLFSVTFPKYSDSIRPANDAYDGSSEYFSILYAKFNPESNEWNKYTLEDMSWQELPGLLTQTDETYTCTITTQNNASAISGMVNKFYKIEVKYGYESTANQLPVYLSPIYVFRGSDNYNYTCRNKNVMDAYNGYQVFCDKPVFAHTMYSKFKLTEGSSAADSHVWEGRGVETGLVYNDGTATTFSYTDSQLTEIPEGCYYTTIFHFVDGTSIMTPVKQKN